MGVGLDGRTDFLDKRLGEFTPAGEVLAGDTGTLLGVDVLWGLELRDVVEQGRHGDDIEVCILVFADLPGEVDDVFDVVEPVVGAVPRVPPHPTAVVFGLDARGEIVVDELLHLGELVVGDPRLLDLNTHRTTTREGETIDSLAYRTAVSLLGVTTTLPSRLQRYCSSCLRGYPPEC